MKEYIWKYNGHCSRVWKNVINNHFDVSYVKDIDFWREKLTMSKIFFAFDDVIDVFFGLQLRRTTKTTISYYPSAKDNNNKCWSLVDIKDHYLMCFVLRNISIFYIQIFSTYKIIITCVAKHQKWLSLMFINIQK